MLRILFVLIAVMAALPAEAQIRKVPESQQELLASFSPVVKKTAPAVVNIYTKRRERVASPLINDPMFQLFFGNRGSAPAVVRERVVQSLGSGVIIDPRGLIVTNGHVIKGADEIRVVLSDRREFDATLIVTDSKTDIALLRVQGQGLSLPFLELKDSDDVEVGDVVLAIGNPFGVGQTVTSGIVSAVARTTLGISDYQFFIQTDAAVNPGNSGGALVTTDGKVIGINTAIYSKTGASSGIGFATPSNIVRAILISMKTDGKIVRPWFGAGFQPVTSQVAESLGLARPSGVLVQRVMEQSPAARAGLEVGDVITRIEEHEVTDPQSLQYRVATYAPGREVMIAYLRKGREQTASLRLEQPPLNPAPDYRELSGQHPLSGLKIANLSPALAHELDIDMEARGVVVAEVKAATPAAKIGFLPGDRIESINGRRVESTELLTRLIKEAASRNWTIAILRGDQRLQLEWRR